MLMEADIRSLETMFERDNTPQDEIDRIKARRATLLKPVDNLTDEELIGIDTIPLNKMFKKQKTPKERQVAIKQWRRTLLNRGYSADGRLKRDNEKADLDVIITKYKVIIKELSAERGTFQSFFDEIIETFEDLVCQLRTKQDSGAELSHADQLLLRLAEQRLMIASLMSDPVRQEDENVCIEAEVETSSQPSKKRNSCPKKGEDLVLYLREHLPEASNHARKRRLLTCSY